MVSIKIWPKSVELFLFSQLRNSLLEVVICVSESICLLLIPGGDIGTGQDMEAFELVFGTLALTSASTQFNPLEGVTKKGWFKLQQYKQDDTIFNTVDVFCAVKIASEVNFSDNIVQCELEVRTLHSIYNTGTIA